MARVARGARRLRALPGRAKVALALALVLFVALVASVVVAVVGDDGGDTAGGGSGAGETLPSTTLATGDLDLQAPEGWQPIPVPALGFGLAVPPGWEAVLLSPDGLATLSGATPAIPGFVEAATAAAAGGGLVYAAGQDASGQVSDVLVRAAPQTGVTDVAGLEAYAGTLAAAAGRTDPDVEVVEDAARPTVRLRFEVGTGEERAQGTETLVLGPNGWVWSVTVTSDDPALHDDLATSITDTLTLSPS
jgi:hypothetical protein